MAEGDGEVVIYRDPATDHTTARYAPPVTPPPRRQLPPTSPRKRNPAPQRAGIAAAFIGWAVATFFIAFLTRVLDALTGTQVSTNIPFPLGLRTVATRELIGYLLIVAAAYALGAYVAQRLRPAANTRGAHLIAWTVAFVAASAFTTRFLPARAALLPAYAPAFSAATTTSLGVSVALLTLLVMAAAAWWGALRGTPKTEVEAWPGGVLVRQRERAS